jgi:RND family efflux transporter MFP subunit
MKKSLMVFFIVCIVGVIIFVLFYRKAEVDSKARTAQNNVTSVFTTEVQRQTLQSSVTKVGTIVANNVVSVASETSGKVVAVYVNVGSYVAAGAPLVKVDDETLHAKFLSGQTAYEKARKDWERAKELNKGEIISDSELETYRESLQSAEADFTSARRNYKNSTITSPIAGLVTDRAVNIGAMVASDTVVATVVDASVYKVDVSVSEEEAFKIKVGDSAIVETDVYPGIKFSGRIQSISGKSDDAHTIPVEVTLSATKEHPLKSGIFGKVAFEIGTKNNALTIPRDALVGSVKKAQVYVVENGIAKLHNIVVGSEYDTQLEVLQGLNDNEQVVVSGQDYLKDNATVNIMPNSK